MIKNLKNVFDHGKAFIAFITAGDPDLEATKEFRENNQTLFHKMIFCGDCGRGMGYHRSIKP